MGKLFDEQHIEIGVKASDWKDAIRKSGEILLGIGSIDETYIDLMIESVEEKGPYIVIAPKFALAHAAPGPYIRKDDISIITLDKPVDFHSDNGEVEVVLCLASKDGNSHIDYLQKVANVLSDESVIDRIANAKNKQEIIDLFTV